MNPLNTDKLEEQLRASRLREVSDLTPPTGGWEAISAQIGTEAAVTTTAATATTTSAAGTGAAVTGGIIGTLSTGLILALAGLAIAAVGVAYYVLGTTPAEPTPVKTPTPVEQITNPETPLSHDILRSKESITASAATTDATNTNNQDIRENSVTSEPSPLSFGEGPGDRRWQPRSDRAHISEANNQTPASNKPNQPSPKTTPAPAPRRPQNPNAPQAATTEQENTQKTTNSSTQDPATTPPTGSVAPEKFQEEESASEPIIQQTIRPKNPVADWVMEDDQLYAASLPFAIDPVDAPPILLADQVLYYTPNEPTNGFPDPFHKGRPKAPAFWQLHASVGYAANQFGFEDEVYGRTESSIERTTFQLPNGELINGSFLFGGNSLSSGNSFSRGSVNAYALRAGINRQTQSGFLWRFSLDLYASKIGSGNNQNLLRTDQILLRRESEELAVTYESGIQYTLFRRKRFKPFVGFGVLNFLHFKRTDEQTFFDERTGQSGFFSREESDFTSGTTLDIDLYITAGFQYQLNEQWSVGLNAWTASDFVTQQESPYHLEVRRTIGRRR